MLPKLWLPFCWNFDIWAVQKYCRSRQELSNEYLLAKRGFDTTENEPSKICWYQHPITPVGHKYRSASPGFASSCDSSPASACWIGIESLGGLGIACAFAAAFLFKDLRCYEFYPSPDEVYSSVGHPFFDLKLWTVRSRLYRRRFSRSNTRRKAVVSRSTSIFHILVVTSLFNLVEIFQNFWQDVVNIWVINSSCWVTSCFAGAT